MPKPEHRAAVLEEIRLIVVEALRNRDVVRPDVLARSVWGNYPDSGLSESQIEEGIRQAAAEAGVTVEPSDAELLKQALARVIGS